MGLFSFIKDAGAKLGFGTSVAEDNAAAALEKNNAAIEKLKETISGLCLEVTDLEIAIEGDTATVSGTALDQTTKEKIVLVVGNTEGIAQVDDQMDLEPLPEPEAEPQPEATFHTVVSGDSLSKIAKKVYGDPMKYTVIFEANKPMLSHPDKIYPGQVLRIPAL